MIKGIEKIEYSKEEALKDSQGGWDVFRYEIGDFPIGISFNSPLRSDRNPSFKIFLKEGIWFYKDFSSEESGTCIQFVQKKHNFSYKEALEYIYKILGKANNNKISITKAPNYEEKEIHIAFTSTRFDNKHAAYWNSYTLSEEFLRQNNVYRVKDLAINHKRVILGKDELTFAYYAPDIDKCKILRIGVQKQDKWRTNVGKKYLWLLNELEGCKRLIVSKSLKDALCLKKLGVCSVATQSENAKIFDYDETDEKDINLVEKLESFSKEIVINFGSDEQGKKQSRIITEKTGWRHYNTPDRLLPDINDVAEWMKNDEKALIEHLKLKNIL